MREVRSKNCDCYLHRSNNKMTSSFLTAYSGVDWHDRQQPSPTRKKRFFGSPLSSPRLSPKLSPKLSPRSSPVRFDRIDDSSEEKTSSDEQEARIQSEKTKQRSNSIISFSSVKKKISTTFQRRNSHSHLQSGSSPNLSRKNAPTRRASTATMPSLTRQMSADTIDVSKSRKSSLRRSSTVAHSMIDKYPDHLPAHPLIDRLRNNIMNMDPFATSSTPEIQSQNRANSEHTIKKFNIYLLGSHSVGKTALIVRFLTGRYIHEYKSSSEEVYNRIVKYGDEQANVTIYANDIENMTENIELDHNSGLMILYSIIDKASYIKAKILLQHLRELSITGQFPVVLVGTKRDVSRLRKVKPKDAFNTANSYNCTQFDVSAAGDKKVQDCFHTLFRQIEIRQLLHRDEKGEGIHTILNPTKLLRFGTYRHGTC